MFKKTNSTVLTPSSNQLAPAYVPTWGLTNRSSMTASPQGGQWWSTAGMSTLTRIWAIIWTRCKHWA